MLQTERRADKDRIPHRLLNETLPRIHAGKLTATLVQCMTFI